VNWIIKASYPHGGHVVMFNDAPLRFKTKQEALDRAEVLNMKVKNTNTIYIVVEDER
jgi:4'-phosphopantetheinyl transferase EntD